MSTKTVTNDHVFIARFAAELLQTRMVGRSNSVRGRLLNILHEALCIHRGSIREASFALDNMASTSSFDTNEPNFRACVKNVIACIGCCPTPVIGEIASTIRRLVTEAGYSDLVKETLEALKRRDEDEKLVGLLKGVLLEQYVLDRRKEIQDFLGPKSAEHKRLAGLIDAVLQ